MTDWIDELDRLEKEATAGPWIPMDGQPYLRTEQEFHVGRFDYNEPADIKLVELLRNHARELIEAYKSFQPLAFSGDKIEYSDAKSVWAQIGDPLLELIKWNRVEDGLPPKGEYLVKAEAGVFSTWRAFGGGYWYVDDEASTNVTHWAHLPSGPSK